VAGDTLTAEGIPVLTCAACGVAILVDPESRDATIWHHPDGAHRIVTPPGKGADPASAHPSQGDLYLAARRVRIDALALAIRLADLGDDLDRVVASLDDLERMAL
jgi:hypothetical protein